MLFAKSIQCGHQNRGAFLGFKPLLRPRPIVIELGSSFTQVTFNRNPRPTSTLAGPLLETFVAAELARQRTWSDAVVDLHHFRDRDGAEVDLVLERRDGCVAAVEIKAGRSVSQSDLRSLKLLRDRVGKEFMNGVILNCGDAVRPLGDRLTVMPISALWAS